VSPVGWSPQAAYHPPVDIPKLVAALVDVETTSTNPDRDRIIELGISSSNMTVSAGGFTKFSATHCEWSPIIS